jgi:hypothetical protein
MMADVKAQMSYQLPLSLEKECGSRNLSISPAVSVNYLNNTDPKRSRIDRDSISG